MRDEPLSPRRLRTFILRLWIDEQEQVRGQISEPDSELDSAEEWRTTFRGRDGLWSLLAERLAAAQGAEGFRSDGE